MSVQPKLGRWRLYGGNVAVINAHHHGSFFPWAGWIEYGPAKCHERWNDDGCTRMQSRGPLDLKEYLDAPTDLAAFIAALKPGDVYRQNDGGQGTFHARTNTPEGECLWVTPAGKSCPETLFVLPNVMQWACFPAGPWVEPTKPQVCYVSYDDSKSTFGGWYMHLKREAAERAPHARELIWTKGKGFELGEVVKQ